MTKRMKTADTSVVRDSQVPAAEAFYVGENVTQEDIKAKFEDGILKICVPKVENKPQIEENKYIAIEG